MPSGLTTFMMFTLLAAAPPDREGWSCEIRLSVPEQLVLSKIEGVILQGFPDDYRLEIRSWPAQYYSSAPPGPRWYRVDEGEEGWILEFRDIDDDELVAVVIDPVGRELEHDIGSEIATYAIAACHAAAIFEQDLARLAGPPELAPAVEPAPRDSYGPQARAPDTGLVVTSLTFGLAGLALGVGGFAYAYQQEQVWSPDYNYCLRTGGSRDECQGKPEVNTAFGNSKVGVGVGSVGAGMLGLGLLLAIPASIHVRSRLQLSRAPRVSGWANRSGGGMTLTLSF